MISKRTVGSRKAYAGLSYGFAVTQGTATAILSCLGLEDDLEFITADENITSIQVDALKILNATIDPAQQSINEQRISFDTNLEHELADLLAVQKDLRSSERPSVFLELN